MRLLLLGRAKRIASLLAGHDSRCIGAGRAGALREKALEIASNALKPGAAAMPSAFGPTTAGASEDAIAQSRKLDDAWQALGLGHLQHGSG